MFVALGSLIWCCFNIKFGVGLWCCFNIKKDINSLKIHKINTMNTNFFNKYFSVRFLSLISRNRIKVQI